MIFFSGENNGNMTENTTLLEVKATAELLWQNFSSDCENSDCGIAAPDTVITALGRNKAFCHSINAVGEQGPLV